MYTTGANLFDSGSHEYVDRFWDVLSAAASDWAQASVLTIDTAGINASDDNPGVLWISDDQWLFGSTSGYLQFRIEFYAPAHYSLGDAYANFWYQVYGGGITTAKVTHHDAGRTTVLYAGPSPVGDQYIWNKLKVYVGPGRNTLLLLVRNSAVYAGAAAARCLLRGYWNCDEEVTSLSSSSSTLSSSSSTSSTSSSSTSSSSSQSSSSTSKSASSSSSSSSSSVLVSHSSSSSSSSSKSVSSSSSSKSVSSSSSTSSGGEPSPDAAWDLEEASGTRVDSAGSLDLADNGSVGSADGYDAGDAASFSGSNYLSVATDPILSISNADFTVACRVYWASGQDVVGKLVNGDLFGEWGISINGDSKPQFFYRGVSAEWGSAISTNTWYKVVAWFDADAEEIFIEVDDGTAVSVSATGATSWTDDTFRIGDFNNPSNPFVGRVDKVRIYKRLLTAPERAAI